MQRRRLLNSKKGSLVYPLLLVATIAAMAIFLLISGYIGKTLATEMKNQMGVSDLINQSFDTTIQTSTMTVNSIWYIVFVGMLFGVLISAYMVKDYPIIFVPVFLILLVTSVIVGVALSNAYESISQVTQLQEQAAYQAPVGFFMSKLPYLALVVGFISIAVTFLRSGGASGSGISAIN